MWYFVWILGVVQACVFTALFAVWLETRRSRDLLGDDGHTDGNTVPSNNNPSTTE